MMTGISKHTRGEGKCGLDLVVMVKTDGRTLSQRPQCQECGVTSKAKLATRGTSGCASFPGSSPSAGCEHIACGRVSAALGSRHSFSN